MTNFVSEIFGMMTDLRSLISGHNALKSVIKDLENGVSAISIKKFLPSYYAFWVGEIFRRLSRTILVVFDDAEDAAYFYEDMKNITESEVYFFPSSLKFSAVSVSKRLYQPNVMMRSEVLRRVSQSTEPMLIVSYGRAISEKTPIKDEVLSEEFILKVGDSIDSEFLEEWLLEENFTKVQFVYEPGQFARRGNIVDIFSFATDYPYRIYFFGDEIEKIKSFDLETQRSLKEYEKVFILPNISVSTSSKKVSFLQNLASDSILIFFDLKNILEAIKFNYKQNPVIEVSSDFDTTKVEFSSYEELYSEIEKRQVIDISNSSLFQTDNQYNISARPQPLFQKNFALLAKYMKDIQKQGFDVFVLSKNPKQIQRLRDIFSSTEINSPVDFNHINLIVKEGFIDEDIKIAFFTEHQIFSRFHRYYLKDYSHQRSKNVQLLKELNDLKPGDYVVHNDFGIGIFRGLKTIENAGRKIEVIQIDYKGGDRLFVNVHSLYKISKYKGGEGQVPTIHSLNSRAWKNLKKRAKRKVKDIARELIALYAKRMQAKGFAFSPDNYLQEALEASFMFEETPDQAEAIESVKRDMEKPVPMDRLVCGDVGFGKTEVAIRAAFKAVLDGKQVALLCPTTVLTYQHYKTFSERLKDFAVEVDFLSRLKTPAQQRETLKRLADGKIDIIIGTHRLVSQDVKFKDLGLLIIDEEQRFGVAVKEKLRQIKVNVDTLTLTATPIPRTLQFSLMGARDLSIINTPPPNRRPIITELHTFNADIIRRAIEYELKRDGQVFFVHNDIASLESLQAFVHKIIPGIKTAIAHGRMKPSELEKIMTDFINGQYDVLITTTIIENGLDIPNVNTIIINNAHKFGLSQLHQLRGRVGRSDRQAFCYLLAPPVSSLNTNAKRRLQTIETFTEIGSGFNIALQDLDIRGAGNLIGAEQSGFINDIGIETFKQILEDALRELKIEEISKGGNIDNQDVRYVSDCQISTDLDAKIPEWYIEDVAERLFFYRKINNAKNQKQIDDLLEELKDRFGQPPQEVLQLLQIVNLRKLAIDLGIEKIILKAGKMIAYFVSEADSPFYDSSLFKDKILKYISLQKQILLKYRDQKVYLLVENVNSVHKAISLLKNMHKAVFNVDDD